MNIKILSESPNETQKIAGFFINAVLNRKNFKPGQALVILLEGELGSGKTEFMKGIVRSLKTKDKVFSPTFLIMKRFALKHKIFKFLWHLDCYRLNHPRQITELGFEEMTQSAQNVIFIEWGDKIKRLLPKNRWTIKFQSRGEKERILTFDIL